MKTAIILTLAASSLCWFPSASAQSQQSLAAGYYVVVGVYAPAQENLAKRFVESVSGNGLQASFGYHERSNLLYVYVHYYDHLKGSLVEMNRLRKNKRFSDAWVKVVAGDIVRRDESPEIPAITKGQAEEPVSPSSQKSASDSSSQEVSVPADIAGENENIAEEIEVTDNEEIVQHPHITLGNTEVFLSLFHARNNRIVDGEVQVVDTDRAKAITRVKGNEYLILPDPKSSSGQLTLICEAFGYRKLQYELNYPVPLADTVKPYIELMGTTVVVNFDLVRYHKGDIATLFNVYFFNDASVMLPESKYELNSLLVMMQERSDYKIRLHGHTNGNYNGKIIHPGAAKNYFSLDESVTTVGTAKDLSRHRAEAIRDYLVSHGISPERVEIKAWGGKRPLFDRHGQNARKNVRVEVEILESSAI